MYANFFFFTFDGNKRVMRAFFSFIFANGEVWKE